ncbi:ORC1-type DNA replication protein [Candidatus Woesearchaeota archaeon]|nr:ORC1-type DNA replication protein [Candidatus Woesearchaeota archaeon]
MTLSKFFGDYLKKEPLFLNKTVFQGAYLPETIPHRDEQINQIAKILAPLLRGDKPSNIFIYGKTGTGKTMSMKYVVKSMKDALKDNAIKFIYVNCKLKRVADTEYRLMAQLAREFGKEIPSTGLPTDEVYKILFNAIEKESKPLLIVLDEIDQLVRKTGDTVLYNLTRCNEELKNAHITIVGLSNDMVFIDNIDPRAKSSLSEEELIFPPYNAIQIQDILKQRVKIAFKKNTLDPGTIEKCAAYSAREHGDARRALELLRVAGELAERDAKENITIDYIDKAEEKIERDRLLDITSTQPKQSQCILYSIIALATNKKGNIFTGEIYEHYKSLCKKTSLRPLTQRRISDVLAELDMLGIINAKIISKGRYGRSREVSLAVPNSSITNIKKTLEEELALT